VEFGLMSRMDGIGTTVLTIEGVIIVIT